MAYLSFSFLLFAEGPDLYFNHYTTENGLSDNTVPYVFQDSKGFIWIATDDGLNMFDGYDFTIYNYNSSNSTSLSSNNVFQNPGEIEKLFRVDVHFTREGTKGEEGTGLGLILCK